MTGRLGNFFWVVLLLLQVMFYHLNLTVKILLKLISLANVVYGPHPEHAWDIYKSLHIVTFIIICA